MAEFAKHIRSRKSRKQLRHRPEEPALPDAQVEQTEQPDIGALITQMQQSPGKMSKKGMAQLQRTIGNRAVQRLPSIGGARTKMPALSMPPLPAIPVQANVVAPGRPVLPSPGSMLVASQFHAAILGAARAPFRTSRAQKVDPAKLAADRNQLLEKIMRHYYAYDADMSLANAVSLHSAIDQFIVMDWDHQSLRDTGLRTEGVRTILENVLATVDRKVREETAKQGGPNDAADAVLNTDKKGKQPKKIKFFEAVGVPIGYYSTLSSKQVKLFKSLYQALAKGNPLKVTNAILALEGANITGFALVKGLFLTAFPKVAGIDQFYDPNYKATDETKQTAFGGKIRMAKVVNQPHSAEELKNESYAGDPADMKGNDKMLRGLTDAKALTPAEMAVLIDYTGGGFAPMNSTLRGNRAEKAEGLAVDTRAKNDVLASALNKLPQYSGMAYRMMNGFADFDATVKPGGMFADLAFMSASKTLQGAEEGGYSGGAGKPGALEVYMLMKTTSAASIGFLSALRNETEVLFKPGVRFKVNAVWSYVDGKIPADAPPEAKMILTRTGEMKERKGKNADHQEITFRGKVRVVELTQT